MPKSLRLIASFLLLIIFVPNIVHAQSNAGYLELKNEYIRIILNNRPYNAGRFSVGTTGGDPDRLGDENKHLIYGGTEPWTSYTTVRIGNENWFLARKLIVVPEKWTVWNNVAKSNDN